jgi:hypothetical protein
MSAVLAQSPLDIRLHPKQGVAYSSTATEILYGGAAGGGKSFFMRAASIIWCAMIPGLNVYLFRRIHADLIKNHIEGSSGFRMLLAGWERDKLVKIVDDEIRFWNGSKIFLCHCEHEKHRFKYLGAEIHVLLIDELTTFTEVIYRFLRMRVRMTSIKVPPQFAGCFPRILAGSNPGNIGHGWVKQSFLLEGDSKVDPLSIRQMPDDEGGMLRQYIPATLDDNPTMEIDDPNYRKRIRGLGNAAVVKAFEKGDWDAVIGSFLEGVWDEDKHVVDPFPIPATWKVWKSMDWGFAKPYSVGWYAMDHDGVVYRWRELYGYGGKANVGTREEASAVAKKILKIEEHDERLGYEYRMNIADSAIFSEQGSENTVGKLFKKHGVRWQPSQKGPRSRINGAQIIVEALKAGKFKVFRTCKHWIRTVPALMPDENNMEDVDTKMEDHAWDETMYAFGRVRREPSEEQKSDPEDNQMYKDSNDNHYLRVGP